MGSIDYAMERAKEYARIAKEVLNPFPEVEAKEDLLKLVDFFVEREY